jgi:hypothetical protein
MSAVDYFLANPGSRLARLRLWLSASAWPDVRDWFLRWVYAQHNARVLADMERRMCAVIHEATGYMMSKPYYTEEAMIAAIREHHSKLYDDGYEDGKEDAAE